VFAAMNNIAREATEAERKAGVEVENGTGQGEGDAEHEKGATEIAEGVHQMSVEKAEE
jgi:hypothetical protein